MKKRGKIFILDVEKLCQQTTSYLIFSALIRKEEENFSLPINCASKMLIIFFHKYQKGKRPVKNLPIAEKFKQSDAQFAKAKQKQIGKELQQKKVDVYPQLARVLAASTETYFC